MEKQHSFRIRHMWTPSGGFKNLIIKGCFGIFNIIIENL